MLHKRKIDRNGQLAPLAALADDEALKEFLAILDWYIAEVKAA